MVILLNHLMFVDDICVLSKCTWVTKCSRYLAKCAQIYLTCADLAKYAQIYVNLTDLAVFCAKSVR